MANGTPIYRQHQPPYRLHLRHGRAPGDVLVMTAAIASLQLQYPGRYLVSVATSHPAIWEGNPYVVHLTPHDCHIADLEYDTTESETGIHFMQGFCNAVGRAIGQPVTLQVDRPALYLTDAEKADRKVSGPYLVVNAGYKTDFTVKRWQGYQAVVDHFGDRVKFVQVGAAEDVHDPLKGVVNLIGQTTHRELFSLVYNSLGGIGPTTFLQHTCAALGKPYWCVLGGREPATWCQYPGQEIFSTVGQLDCCKERACWKARTVALGDWFHQLDRRRCELPVMTPTGPVAGCMDAIPPAGVIDSLETFLGANVATIRSTAGQKKRRSRSRSGGNAAVRGTPGTDPATPTPGTDHSPGG